MAGTMAWICVCLAFLVSPNLLFVLGIAYASDAGSALERLHVVTVLSAFALLWLFLFSDRSTHRTLHFRHATALLAFFCLLLVVNLLRDMSLTNILTSMITPFLVLVLLDKVSAGTRQAIGQLLIVLLFANSAMAICEQVFDWRLLPRIAGTQVYSGDLRSIGLLGHPLTASTITGAYLLYLAVERLAAKISVVDLAQFCLHFCALILMGGRLVIAATLVLIVLYVLFDGRRPFGGRMALAHRCAVALLAASLAAICLGTGLADGLLARLHDDEGSFETRLGTLEILAALSPWQVLSGIGADEKSALAAALAMRPVIEVTWIAWVIDYGAAFATGLVLALFAMLRAAARGGGRAHAYMTALFLISVSGFLGLGGKTMLLTIFLVMLATLRPHLAVRANPVPDALARAGYLTGLPGARIWP